MKNLLDKPYKKVLCIILVVVVSILYSSMILMNTEKVKTEEPKIVEETTLNTVEEPIEIPPTIEPPQEIWAQEQQVPSSRGGVTTQSLTEKQIIQGYVREISARYPNVDPYIIMSVIQTESTYNPRAKNGNCLGLMQVSSYWHKDRAARLGVTDFYNPYGNILLGIDYISELLNQYKDIRLILMMYNMNHNTALSMYKNGQISEYAQTIITRAEQYKKGE